MKLNNPQRFYITEALFVSLITLIIILMKVNAFRDFQGVLFSDNAIYTILTNRFYEGNLNEAMHIWWQPFLPFVGSLFMHLGFSDLNALFYVNLLSGSLIFIPVFYLTKKVTNNNFFAVLAGLLTSFNSKLIASYFQLLTENLYVLLFTSAMLFSFLYLSGKKIRYIFPAGIFYGLGYLTRSDILLPMQIFAFSIFILFLAKKITFKKLLLTGGLLGIVFITVISPYLYFNIQKFGYLNPSAKLNASLWMPAYFAPQENFTTTYAQEVWSVDTPNYDSRYFNEKFDYGKYKINMIEGARDRFKAYSKILKAENKTYEIYLFLFGFTTSIFYFWKNNKAGLFLNTLIPLNFFISLPFHPGVDIRYLFWAYPLVIFFSAIGLFIANRLLIKIIKNSALKNYNFVIFPILAIVTLTFFFSEYKNNLNIPPISSKNSTTVEPTEVVGSYILKIAGPGKKIMYRREALTYYAKGITIYIPTSIGPEELKKYAEIWQPDYLVADKYTFPPEIPLGFLVDENKAPVWLKPVKIWEGDFSKTILYKFEL